MSVNIAECSYKNCEEKREEQLLENCSNSQEGIQEKGEHYFPYIKYVENEFGTSMN